LIRRHALPLAILVSAVSLAACGGGGESDEEQIVGVITTSVTGHDPAECEELSTLAFMEQSTDGTGEEAVKACEAEKVDTSDDPDSVKVTGVKVAGSKASADVAFTGGSFDGQKVEVTLVEEDGDWKLDQIERFLDFSRGRLIAVFERTFAGSSQIAPELADCLLGALRAKSDGELEELVLEDREALFEIVVGCEKSPEG
jgi:hypothetical protein